MSRFSATAALALALLAAPAASAQPNFFFVHVPGSDTNVTQAQIDAGLQEIGQILADNWSLGHGGETPTICWVGYGGPWSSGGTNQPNHASMAANGLGNASDTDNVEGYSMPISYCAVDAILDELLGPDSPCDIVIGLGERGGSTGFDLEDHGAGQPVPDCDGETPGGPICRGPEEGCSGTDWDDPSYGECEDRCTFAELVKCKYEEEMEEGDVPLVNPGNAGAFLCGYWCCHRSQPDEEPPQEQDPQQTDTERSGR
jgi:pyrrolidone-carboxylate peptidase